MIRNILISLLTLFINNLYSQKINQDFKIHPKKISQKIKIDGLINQNAWKDAYVAKNYFMKKFFATSASFHTFSFI